MPEEFNLGAALNTSLGVDVQEQKTEEPITTPEEPIVKPAETTQAEQTKPEEVQQNGILGRFKEIFPDATDENSVMEKIKLMREEQDKLRHENNLRAEIEPELLKQNAFAKLTGIKNPELYEKVVGNTTEMSDLDMLMLGKKIEYYANWKKPMSQALEAEMVADYKAKFFLNQPEEHEDPISEGKKELGANQLKMEANAVRENISKIAEKVNTAVPSLENTRERALQNSGKWDESVTKYFTTPELKKINQAVSLSGMENFIKDGGTLNVEFNIPDAEYAKELAPFIQHAKQTGMEWSEAQQTQIAELVKLKCMVKYQPELLNQAVKMGVEQAYKGWVADTTNTKKPQETPPKLNQQPKTINTNDESDRLAAALGLV